MTTYPVPLVGEQHCQAAIAACSVGDAVTIAHETGNPYDAEAIAAYAPGGAKIGHVPRGSFIHRALFAEGKGASATIRALGDEGTGFAEVVLNVSIGGPVETRRY